MSKIATPVVPEARPAPAQQLTELRAIQALVNELAGLPDPRGEAADDSADQRYDAAPPIVQSRFDALSAEAAAIAAAGLSALIQGRRQGTAAAAAAAQLAREMDRAIRTMEKILQST